MTRIYRRVAKEDIPLIVELRKQYHLSAAKLADKFDVSAHCIRDVLRKHGNEPQQPGPTGITT